MEKLKPGITIETWCVEFEIPEDETYSDHFTLRSESYAKEDKCTLSCHSRPAGHGATPELAMIDMANKLESLASRIRAEAVNLQMKIKEV